MQCKHVDRRIDSGVSREQRLRRGSKQQAFGRMGKIQRLDSDTITREYQLAVFLVTDRESEHAVQALKAADAPLGVGPENDLGITGGDEAVTFRGEDLAQLRVVVDRPVEDQRQTELLIDHRLRSLVGQVDDRKAAVPEPGIGLDVTALPVRTASCEPVHHSINARLVGRRTVKPDFTADAAHSRTGTRD